MNLLNLKINIPEIRLESSIDQWKILAGLRFFLAWVVFCVHIDMFGFATNDIMTKILVKPKEFGGVAAVIGFLLVSGFSIAHSASRSPKGFYNRRILRIYPLYFLAIAFSLTPFIFLGSYIKHPIFDSTLPDLWTTIGIFGLLQGFIVDSTSANGVIWTLSLEVFFYLLTPFLIKTSTRNIIILIVVSSLAFAAYPYLHMEFYFFMKYGLAVLFLGWAWLIGFLYQRLQKNVWTHPTLICLGSFLLSVNPTYGNRLSIFTYVISSLVLIYSNNIKLPNLILNIFNYLGNISYPLYLFHMPSLIFGYHLFGFRSFFSLSVLTLILSSFFFHLVDVPMRFDKHR